jgi:hypothetical protein
MPFIRVLRAMGLSGLLVVVLAGCGKEVSVPAAPSAPGERIDRALARAAAFLIRQQDSDGAWRSDFYGPFRDGPSLTPLIVEALDAIAQATPTEVPDLAAACRKGRAYLAVMVRPDGTIEEGPHGLNYPVYTAALSVVVLSRTEETGHRPARDAWLKYLRARQLTEQLGWQPSDRAYGGWGYCALIPRKPPPGEFGPPLLESNLSATVFALSALRAAGCPQDDPSYRAARIFLERCQNHAEDEAQRDPAFDDGGFFFIYDDPVRNKAGAAGKDRHGRERFRSYGSTTADGLYGLLACGLGPDHPGSVAARCWLETHFDVSTHPGDYPPNRAAERESVYYYYSRSLARALSALDVTEVDTPRGKVRWAAALAAALLQRQRDDGSWANEALAQREDDPLVATSEAIAALAACRARQ